MTDDDTKAAPTERELVRTLALSELSDAQASELARALDPKEAILASPDRFALRERYALMAAPIGAALLAAWAVVDFGDACDPLHDPANVVLYALPLAPLAWLAVRFARWLMLRSKMPFAPGVYVLDQLVVVAHEPAAISFVPLANTAGVSEPSAALWGAESSITLWMEGHPAITCRAPTAQAAALVERLESARLAAATTGEATSLRGRRGTLGELRASQVWENALTTRPRPPLAPSIAASALAALALGALALGARDLASDHIAISSAIDARDVEAMRCYVASPGLAASQIEADVLPRIAFDLAREDGSVAALRQFVQDYPSAPMMAEARELWIAAEFAEARQSEWSLDAFISRFPDDTRATEATAMLPRLSLEQARRGDLVAGYAHVIRAYPDTPEAQEARTLLHARYAQALQSLQARGARAEAAAYFTALFAHLETQESPQVWVRFRLPSAATLAAFDQVVAERQERDQGEGLIQPIAPAFARRVSERREVLVHDRLQRALADVITPDVLPLAHGPRLPEPHTPAELEELLAELDQSEREAERARILERDESRSDHPEIRIRYDVTPTGAIYESTPSSGLPPDLEALLRGSGARRPVERRRFAGFRLDFEVEMRVPERDERRRFEFGIEPPASIHVDGGSEAPTRADVYETMVTAAFDQLGDALVAAFLGDESQGSAAPSEP